MKYQCQCGKTFSSLYKYECHEASCEVVAKECDKLKGKTLEELREMILKGC